MKFGLPQILAARHEQFGGIVATERPRALVHLDRALMRRLGYGPSALWDNPAPSPLSAPTEVHLVLSKRCAAGCKGCYVDATPKGEVMSLDDAKRSLDELARLKVFHIALGGGEAMDIEYLFEVADYARTVGIIPNLTTAGLTLTEAQAERCRVFGQINVSVDGVGAAYEKARGFDGYDRAERALRLLRAVTRHVGINFVVSRSSYDGIDEVARLAKKLKLSELELLRFKPAGRGGGAMFDAEDLTPEQARGIYPKALRLALRRRLRVKLDCSFAPMVFAHNPPPALASFFGVQGCVGGDVLAAVHPDGVVTGCSFGGPPEADGRQVGEFEAAWKTGFRAFRDYVATAPEPCASCRYLSLCRGGCRVVSAARGQWSDPDPGCPRVQDYRAKNPPVRHSMPIV